MLTDVMRQGEQSSIVANAIKINNGDTNLITDDSFQIFKVHNEHEAFLKLSELAKIEYNHNKPFETQILAPAYKGEAGVTRINETIQNMVSADKEFIIYGKNKFCIKDKVMFLHNSYDNGYCNGDTGILVKIEPGELTIQTGKEQIIIPKSCLEDLTLAYASTIHKSQGSETKCIILYMPEYPRILLKRKLVYTAITRAKEKVIIVTVNNALDKAIINDREEPRHSGLLDLFKTYKLQSIA